MSKQDFLVELGTEELPPKALSKLSKAFETGILDGLKKESLSFESVKRFATPRRLAVLVSGLQEKQADKNIERFGPAVKAAFDGDGNPTPAASGFAKSCGVDVSKLGKAEKDGVEKLAYSSTQPGRLSTELLPDIVNNSLLKLPIPKRMRWGASREEFVRPVHWLVMLFGEQVVECTILGINSGRSTRGHRFHHNSEIKLTGPSGYEAALENPGSVIADLDKRKEMVRELIRKEGEQHDANTVIDEELLEEVTSLVEYPVALTGKFEEYYLHVPAEALILAMKSHQKCFYLEDDEGNLLPMFVTVSNIRSKDPAQVIEGNERVIRPRLADAQFFFETDKQKTLEDNIEALKKVVFQEKLGTVYERSKRVAQLASSIAKSLNENEEHCRRAAMLSKCDLVTNMVGEFADLQGLMGYYYALNDGEPEEVANAINEQYMPRFSGDKLPSTSTGSILAMADKLDAIVGLFAIGQPPTGSKDPFALRRSAIGLLRIMIEREIDLDVMECIENSLTGFGNLEIAADTANKVFDFLLERFRAWYIDEGISINIFQSVMALKPRRPLDFHKRVLAVHNFSSLEQAESLASANKRVSNLLDKQGGGSDIQQVDESLFEEDAEKVLLANLQQKELDVAPLFESGNYTAGLEALAELRQSVDEFFDKVLVVCEDEALRNNRIAILQRLRAIFLETADISYLHNK